MQWWMFILFPFMKGIYFNPFFLISYKWHTNQRIFIYLLNMFSVHAFMWTRCAFQAKDAFRITHLVIPKQTGTPDSCDMYSEEEIFSYQDEFDLITLGWIHVSTVHISCTLVYFGLNSTTFLQVLMVFESPCQIYHEKSCRLSGFILCKGWFVHLHLKCLTLGL